MPDYKEYDKLYIDIAKRVAMMSKATRLKVGAIIVSNHSILSYGYNGTPRGADNTAEYMDDQEKLVTKPDVVHSEINAVLKLIKNGVKIENATMYLTHSPCKACAIFIYQSEVIKEVVYDEEYRITDGIEFLRSAGIKVRRSYTE